MERGPFVCGLCVCVKKESRRQERRFGRGEEEEEEEGSMMDQHETMRRGTKM